MLTSPSLSTLVWILIAWVLLLHFFTLRLPSKSNPSPPSYSLQRQLSRLTGLVRHSELQEIEEIPVFGRHRRKSRKASSDDPVSDLPLEKRRFFFPRAVVDPNTVATDERYYFFPGREWRDLDGLPIQAHGGGILYVPRTQMFYWYGENKRGPTYRLHKKGTARVDVVGISCYSSQDLWHWKNEGLVLQPDFHNVSSDIHTSKVMERPKVIYNELTNQYVMWFHVDNANYSKASVGIARSSAPEGPFLFLGSMKPHGFDSRDMTVFKDEDGSAFLVYSSNSNSELHVTQLRDDYLGLQNRFSRALVNQHREAPAVFKHQGLYYMITSGCTGWSPNSAFVHAAESMLGHWQTLGDPCVGASEELRGTTFYSQVSFVLPLPGAKDTFVFMGDRWNPGNLSDSRYVWLPLTVDGPFDEPVEDGSFSFPIWSRVSVRWHSKWKLPESWNTTVSF